ncbi:glutamyl-tRNA reductase [Fulvivirga lutea]|uniref:Glutamyl-tRNA reductase n=1 Tax=Fulvivirga lutea TaxID=2810512 RepID=A0A975A224_9BACT|nr:glutamyl-tRNA reductase [Fulvivirga lutea]QSE98845.1 glutamyl-tRNA reductase [Fulvivirga lutea]
MENAFKISGFSFKNTPLEIREKLALNEPEAKQLMQFLNQTVQANDLMVLSTCNRTEIYYDHELDLNNEIATSLSLIKGLNKEEILKHLTCTSDSEEAVNHLFEVAMGLDAQVVGDIQISNQVKKAYQWSADENVAGPFLHRLMHTIFYANKRVVQETAFRDGAASVSYAAKELIEDLTSEFKEPKILILGLGEIGEDVCRNYAGTTKSVTIANRTKEKAVTLGVECNFPVIDFNKALETLADYDVIVSSVAHSEPIITRDMIVSMNILSHKFFIDLSVPRSIETSIEDHAGALLYNIDNIQSKASEALNKRIAAVPDVKRIISETQEEFGEWSREMAVSPTIKKLKNALEAIRQEELKRYLKDGDSTEAKVIDTVTKSMMQKIIKLPVLQLKAACKRGEAETLIDVLNDLFDLDKADQKVK